MPDNEPNGTPAASDAASQRDTNGTTTVPASDQGSADGQQPNDSVRDPIAKAVADAEAKYRTQLRQAEKRIADFEADKKAREEATLSETEKLQKRYADLQASTTEKERLSQERVIRAELRAQAAALGLKPELAARLVDYAAIEYDEYGDPTNIAALLGTAISTYGLAPTASQPQQPASPLTPTSIGNGSANPARTTNASGALSWEYLNSLSNRQYADLPENRRQEIKTWMAANPQHR